MDYDLIIIGGGPAGLTAGLYASRALIKTLMLDKLTPGGQMLKTSWIDNYPGFENGVSSVELTDKMLAQAKRFGLEERHGEVVGVTKLSERHFRLELSDGKSLTSKAVIVATGAGPKTLNVPGEQELTGRGVSYCATCDGFFFRGMDIAVVGGGDSAIQEALFLAKFANKVYVIHRRDKLRATGILQDRAFKESKITFVWNTVVKEIQGEHEVTGLLLQNVKTGETSILKVSGVFIYIGIEPYTRFLGDLVDRDEQGFIITDEWMQTKTKGLFAAGDCRSKPLRQVVTACGEGATAAFAAEHYLHE